MNVSIFCDKSKTICDILLLSLKWHHGHANAISDANYHTIIAFSVNKI